MRFDADDNGRKDAVGEMRMDGGGESRRPHAEGRLVNVADWRVAAGDVEFEGGVGVAELVAELGGYENGDVEDAG